MKDSRINWDSIIHKNVRSSDDQNAGIVTEVHDETVTLASPSKAEFEIPKDHLEVDGGKIKLDVPYGDLYRYARAA